MTNTNEVSVFILCGGKGSRLQSMTQAMPKALVPVNGQPILKIILEQFREQGFKRYILGTGYLSERIEGYLAANFNEMNYSVCNGGVETSMLQRIMLAAGRFGSDEDVVLVAYGDTFIDLNFHHLIDYHRKGGREMTIVTGKIKNPFGIVSMDEHGGVKSFTEKPVFDYYIGCLVFTRKVLNRVTPGLAEEADGMGLVKLFQQLIEAKQLHAYQHTGLQVTFNTEPELMEADKVMRGYRTIRETI